MAVTYEPNIEAIGGGYGGGFGANPLLWLITLGFLKGNDGLLGGGGNAAGAGVLAGETQGKIDCLAQGQQNILGALQAQTQIQQFDRLAAEVALLANVSRDQQAALTAQINDFRAQEAECCCELRTGQAEIKNAIAMQTNDLNTVATANTQRVIDAINAQTLEQKNDRIMALEREAQTAQLTTTITSCCCPCGGNGNGGGNNIDINVLAAALARNSGGFNPGPGQGN